MNPTGRIVGGTLVAIALLWILRIAGALPFSNRSTNQVAAQIPPDRPPITSFNASRSATASSSTGTQSFAPNGTTSGNGSSTIADLTDPTGTGIGTDTSSATSPANGTGGGTTPVVRAGW